MYEPKYQLTHSILSNIVGFEIEKKGIRGIQIDSELKGKLRLTANSNDIFHLGHLFGANVTLKTARKVASGKTLKLSDYKGMYLTNFRSAIEYINSTQTSYYPVQGTILLHLNKILVNNIAEEWDAKFRTSGEGIDSRDDTWISFRDERIGAPDVQARSFEAIDWFTTFGAKIHPLIRIPIVIYRLIRISPFVTANKLTILAVVKYLSLKGECSIGGMLPVLKHFDVYEDEYIESWRHAAQTEDDITLFIERFTRNVAKETYDLAEGITKKIEEEKEKNKQPFLSLNRRQLKILRYLQNIPEIRREEYVQMMDVSTMTAYRDMNMLLKKGLVKVEGQGRGTRYMLVSR